MHFVNELLLVGNVDDAQSPAPFIKSVLFVSGEHTIKPPKGVAYHYIPLKEYGEADPKDVKAAVDWMEQQPASNQMMICCRAGMGRSVSMIIAYLVCVKGMKYDEAESLLKARRPGASPIPKLKQTIERVQQMRQAGSNAGQDEGLASGHSAASTWPQGSNSR
jgi:protein-tyrosine phosphatase